MTPKMNESDSVIHSVSGFTIIKTGSKYVVTRTDTNAVSTEFTLVGLPEATTIEPVRAGLRPELREAFEDTWKRHEAAYRYLGR